ncbi:nucleoside hydrolase [Pseudoneobacillus rhizosphaerae]|uniref:Pyrimidine-specific ribonucleoside hydrolase RihA n=1 Tax=Pseudoneobacillus rhizosphaerae TaxID=2880968 RepID=A0A9C7G5W1_9BACI|nr:nucleoside hydrolase [Pseudoneobacillus rhizosphaerae]CAG9606394.1 Pyrimidine-specific ribonucleoside hydrolase RihA [Pseudoneobacillus rhizosphaerae]
MGKKVLLFGDVGVDDTVALLYGYFNEQIDIVGVVADYGNISREMTLRNIIYLIRLFNMPEVKVILGAEKPMTGEEPTFYPEVHGVHGLGPIIPSPMQNLEVTLTENFYEIVNLINQYKEELTIVNTGRLTSLATMFILYRELMKQVKEIYIMGGAFWVPGNVTAVSEANIYGDPIAAKIVLQYANNLTIIPLNVTDRAIVTPGMVDYIHAKGKASVLKPMLDYYYQFYKKRNPAIKGSPVHDAITLMATIHEDWFTFKMLPVHVITAEGISRGQTIADIRPWMKFEENEKKHRIAFDFNYNEFFSDFMTTMTGEKF